MSTKAPSASRASAASTAIRCGAADGLRTEPQQRLELRFARQRAERRLYDQHVRALVRQQLDLGGVGVDRTPQRGAHAGALEQRLGRLARPHRVGPCIEQNGGGGVELFRE
jgi:hypothetical protein